MPVPSSVPELHDFTVRQVAVDGTCTADFRVTATYFTEDGTYTLFKGSNHAAVAAFRTELITSIVRSDASHD